MGDRRDLPERMTEADLDRIALAIADRIAPSIVRALDSRREEILANVPWPARKIITGHWNVVQDGVEKISETALYDALKKLLKSIG